MNEHKHEQGYSSKSIMRSTGLRQKKSLLTRPSLRGLYRSFSKRKVGIQKTVEATKEDKKEPVGILKNATHKNPQEENSTTSTESQESKADLDDDQDDKKDELSLEAAETIHPSKALQAVKTDSAPARPRRRNKGLGRERNVPPIQRSSKSFIRRANYKETLLKQQLKSINKRKEEELNKIASQKQEIIAKLRASAKRGTCSEVEDKWHKSQVLVNKSIKSLRDARNEHATLTKSIEQERVKNRMLALERTQLRQLVMKGEALISTCLAKKVEIEEKEEAYRQKVIEMKQILARLDKALIDRCRLLKTTNETLDNTKDTLLPSLERSLTKRTPPAA